MLLLTHERQQLLTQRATQLITDGCCGLLILFIRFRSRRYGYW